VLYNRKSIRIITPPAALPVTLQEVKAMLVIDGNDDDAMLTAFMQAATDAARQYIRRSIVTETLELVMDGFNRTGDDAALTLGPGVHTVHYPSLVASGAELELPFGPVASITSITTYNRANAATVFDAGAYYLAQDRVVLNESNIWPTDLRRRDGVVIRYVSGTAPGDVPPSIRQAIKQHVLAMYECREGCEMPAACRAILAGYRRMDGLGWL
jgi:hypothetical protein